MASITVKIPDEMEQDLANYTEGSGHYMNTSELVRDALRRFLENNSSRSDECPPSQVVDHLQEGIPVEFESWDENGGSLTVRNPFKDYCVVVSGRRIGPDGDELATFRTEMSSGETETCSINYVYGSTEGIHYEIESFVGEPDSDGRCRSATDRVPIGSKEVLVLERGSFTKGEIL